MIRSPQPRDYPAVAKLLAETMLWHPELTPDGVRHWLTTQPERARMQPLVAEDEGRIVGYAESLLAWWTSGATFAEVWVGVAEAARGRGLGTELYRRAEESVLPLGLRKLQTTAVEGTPGIGFALARGFVPTRTAYHQRLELADADLSALSPLETARAAEGLRVVTLGEIRDLPALHRVYAAASLDVPDDDPDDDVRPEEFERHILGDPQLSRDASMVVLDGERPVSLAFVLVNPETRVGVSDLTGTLPGYRGRGLARLAKLALIREARRLGVTAITTENDETNTAMRALNESLGYRRVLTMTTLKRDL